MVAASELLSSSEDLEVSVEGEATGRCCPWALANVLASITEEVEVGKEGVIDNLFPLEGTARRDEGFGSRVVLVEG